MGGKVGDDTGDACMDVGVVTASEGRVVIGVMVMEAVDVDVGHAGVPFLQEDEAGDGRVAAVEPVDSEEDEAEDEDVDNRTAIIQQYFQ
ncbi:hypothetical protein NDU88_009702 [Pleurodeles waltl]|uniref:Uncharacterized protein n=1 Tax=Pleurodeles waltl TaxID=8319 RepID=A0AAV7PWK2_PLEWA|nr:hypothetical protein NDU88_009702 [Pleurodeles waltl]